MSIMHCPLAMALYIKYCQSHNRETLRDIYNQYDDFHSQAIWFITESYQRKVGTIILACVCTPLFSYYNALQTTKVYTH